MSRHVGSPGAGELDLEQLRGLRPLVEAAVTHGILYGTARYLVMTRRVRGLQLGRAWFCDPDDLGRWAREHGRSGRGPAPAA